MYIIDRLDEVPDGIVMSVSVCHSDGHCPLIFVVGDGFIQEYYETSLIDRYIVARILETWRYELIFIARISDIGWNFRKLISML